MFLSRTVWLMDWANCTPTDIWSFAPTSDERINSEPWSIVVSFKMSGFIVSTSRAAPFWATDDVVMSAMPAAPTSVSIIFPRNIDSRSTGSRYSSTSVSLSVPYPTPWYSPSSPRNRR